MSASLVGSEMCIRDSTGTVGVRWGWRPESQAPSVSYTHLTLPTN
ncbi:hypothetical protein JMUB7543_28520 [Staphylococcus aureus]